MRTQKDSKIEIETKATTATRCERLPQQQTPERRKLPLLLAIAVMLLAAMPAQATVMINATEVGGDVVFNLSGDVDLNSFATFYGSGPGFTVVGIGPTQSNITFGSGPIDIYTLSGRIGPSEFGPGAEANATSTTGAAFGFFPYINNPPLLALPQGSDGSGLAASITFESATFASLGINHGTYEWTWSYLGVSDNLILIVGSNLPPAANAGIDQSIYVGNTVGLDGSLSSDDYTASTELQYSWSLTEQPAGSSATLSNADTATPSFVADLEGNYVVQLVVTDEEGLVSEPDEVLISILPLGESAIPVTFSGGGGTALSFTLSQPVTYTITAAAGTDHAPLFVFKNVNAGSFGSGITGTLSFSINGGPAQSFSGVGFVASGSTAGSLTAADLYFAGQTPGVTVGDVIALTGGTLTTSGNVAAAPASGHFNTFVFDFNGQIVSTPGTVTDAAPTANAGLDQSIHAGTTVNLDGSLSFDDNTPSTALQYSWSFTEQPAGSSATLVSADTATPSFVADLDGNYVVQLVVTDEEGLASAPDEVLISSFNQAPTAFATASTTLPMVGDPVTLDGSTSSDPEGDPLTYSWTVTSAPAGSVAGIVDADASMATFTPDVLGQYEITLTVSDFLGAGTPASVTLVAGDAAQFAEEQIIAAAAIVAGLPQSQITRPGNRKDFEGLLRMAAKYLRDGDVPSAIHELTKAIGRTDGCALRGEPDGSGPGFDWISDCAAQGPVYDDLTAALNALQP